MVSKTLCSHFSSQGSYYSYTHAWTKLHNEVMSSSLVLMSVDYAWPLPAVNPTTVRDLTVPSVSSLPLSVTVRSCHVCINLSCLCSRLLSHQRCTLAGSLTSTVTKQPPSPVRRHVYCLWMVNGLCRMLDLMCYITHQWQYSCISLLRLTPTMFYIF